jgi:predicted GTPase
MRAAVKGLSAGCVVVIGKTGAGKSRLICALLGDTLALFGPGAPKTQDLQEMSKIDLGLIHTPGFEVQNAQEQTIAVQNEVLRRSRSDNPDEHICACRLCIDEGTNRLEPCDR